MCMDGDFPAACNSSFSSVNALAPRFTPSIFLVYLRIFETATAPTQTVSQPSDLCHPDATWGPIKRDAAPLKPVELVKFALRVQKCCSAVFADEAKDVVKLTLLKQHGSNFQIPWFFQDVYPDQALLLLVTGALGQRILSGPLKPSVPVFHTFRMNAWALQWLWDSLSSNTERFNSFVGELKEEMENATESSCDGRRLLALCGVQWTSLVVTERVEQSLVGQCGQAALQVQQVGDASAEAAVRVGQSADERAAVGRAAQSPLVQVSRSVSWRGVVKHSITAFPSGPGAGRKRLSASTSFLTRVSSPPTTTSGRPLRRQNTACWENEFCLRNLRALSPAFLLLLLLCARVLLLLWMFWVGEGGSEEPVKLVQSEASSTLSSLRGVQGGDQRSNSARAAGGGAKFTWRSGTDCTRLLLLLHVLLCDGGEVVGEDGLGGAQDLDAVLAVGSFGVGPHAPDTCIYRRSPHRVDVPLLSDPVTTCCVRYDFSVPSTSMLSLLLTLPVISVATPGSGVTIPVSPASSLMGSSSTQEQKDSRLMGSDCDTSVGLLLEVGECEPPGQPTGDASGSQSAPVTTEAALCVRQLLLHQGEEVGVAELLQRLQVVLGPVGAG
ncbi:hypothetical protein INR49_003962, partial [Caranx melampygus]